MLLIQVANQSRGDGRDVAFALAQGRQRNVKHVEAVEEVFAQPLVANGFFRRLIGSREHTDRDGDIVHAAQAAHFGILQHAQQFGLRANGHLANFVEQQSSSLSVLKAAGRAFDGTGKGALFMPKKLAFHERFRHGRAIHGKEWSGSARAELMNRSRGNFLPGAALTRKQNCRVCWRDLFQ